MALQLFEMANLVDYESPAPATSAIALDRVIRDGMAFYVDEFADSRVCSITPGPDQSETLSPAFVELSASEVGSASPGEDRDKSTSPGRCEVQAKPVTKFPKLPKKAPGPLDHAPYRGVARGLG